MTAPEPLAPKSLVERLREAADIYRPFAGFGDLADLLEEAAQALKQQELIPCCESWFPVDMEPYMHDVNCPNYKAPF